jgi:AcrR family transcriptional regulator
MLDTRQKILDTAERLFGEQGYAATSLRQIIGEAGVNVASIHYHFGSKEELLDEVVMRKAGPVNERRLEILDRLEASGGVPGVEEVLGAFFQPMAEAAGQNRRFVAMMGRLISEGMIQGIVQKHFATVTARISAALQRALPELPPEEFMLRMHFTIGAMAHSVCGGMDWTGAGGGPADLGRRIERLVTFAAGGFRAPATATTKIEEK